MTVARTHRSAGASYLHDASNIDTYRSDLTAAVELIADRWPTVEHPFSGVTAAELKREFDAIDLDVPLGDLSSALTELAKVYLDDAIYFHDPGYVAHLNCPVIIPALVGEVVLTAVNSSLDTWDQSAGATLIERRLIDWVCDLARLGPDADGIFTSGGTQSNLQALHLARGEYVAQQPVTRLPEALGPLRILASQECHFSVQKSASILGLGADAVLAVPCDEARRMDATALGETIEACHDDGLAVMAVVATAGTTDFGSIDPLAAITDLCRRYGIWCHIDAAYGGGLLASNRRRARLRGIEHADSITVDFHKSFFQPVSSSVVLVRDRTTLRHATYNADYLNPADVDDLERPNQVAKSLQTTRRFDALKLWLSLRVMGADVIGEMFDTVIDRATELWADLIEHPELDIAGQPEISTLLLRYVPPDADPDSYDQLNAEIREELFRSGRAVVAGTVVDGRRYLKLTLLNPATSLASLHAVIDQITATGRRLVTERHAGRVGVSR